MTVNELAEVIVNLCCRNLEILHVEPREGDIKNSQADIEKAKRIGYKPEYSLEEGQKKQSGGLLLIKGQGYMFEGTVYKIDE